MHSIEYLFRYFKRDVTVFKKCIYIYFIKTFFKIANSFLFCLEPVLLQLHSMGRYNPSGFYMYQDYPDDNPTLRNRSARSLQDGSWQKECSWSVRVQVRYMLGFALIKSCNCAYKSIIAICKF